MQRAYPWIIVIGVTGACADVTTPDDGGPELPASAVEQIEALLAEKHARTPAQRKIASQLLYTRSGRFPIPPASEVKDPDRMSARMELDAAGRVLIDVKGDLDAGLRVQIESRGGEVVGASRAHGSVRAWLSLERVEELAGDDVVRAIRPALQATTWSGSVRSAGVVAHAVERGRKWFAVDGTGTRVGVLSDSDDHKEASIASGDLPAGVVTLPGQSGRPGTGEGTAMMEVIHDVAPGAQLYFATGVASPESFADNIRALRFQHDCDVIVDDIAYYAESPYQDDIIAAAVDEVTADGAVYVAAAGNGGNFDDGTSGTWEGDYLSADALATLPSGYTVHNFGARTISNRIEAAGGPLVLHWSDASSLDQPIAANDYDLFLLDRDMREVIVAATDIQDGAGLPFELLDYNIPPDYRIVIAAHPAAQPRAVRTQLFGGELGLAKTGAIYGHAGANGAITVGAVDVALADGGEFVAGPSTPLELYSGDGYRRLFYRSDGSLIGTGPLIANGGELRKKPDVAAADGVATTVPGLNPFWGTSAAAPHVAGIAALMKAAVPSATPARIRDTLRSGSLDIEATGVDRNAGYGIASAMNGLTRVGAVRAAYLELAGVTVTPTSSDAVLPGGGARLAIQLVNRGGASATAISATLASSSPDVTIVQGTTTFPNAPSGATTTAASQLEIAVGPAALCGGRLPLTLAIDFTGVGIHPTLLELGVQIGRPGPPTTFAYAGPVVPIPDDDPDGVGVPIAVALAGPVSSVRVRVDGGACSVFPGATTVGIDHTWVGDLALALTAPSGRRVVVADRPGTPDNNGNNLCQTILDDAAPASIQDVLAEDAPFTGAFAPASPLAVFAGEAATGTWIITASDNFPSDTGSLRAVSLEVSGYSCTP